MTEIPKAPIARICKKAGAERISKDAETALVEAVEKYTETLSEGVVDISNHAGRKTIQVADVEMYLKHFQK